MNAPVEPPIDPPGLPRDAPDVPPRVRRVLLAMVAVSAGLGFLGTALSQYLLVEHPLILIGLNPDSRHLVLAANRVELWQAVAVGASRRGFNFIATYGLAGLYGYMLITWIEKRGAWAAAVTRLLERLYLRLGVWLVVLVPLYWVAALAGVARLGIGKFALAIIPGQIAFVWGTLYFGEAIEQWTEPIIAFVSQNVVACTLVCIALVLAQRVYARWRKRDPAEPELPL